MTDVWYSVTARAAARPDRLRTARRQRLRPARLPSNGTSLCAIQPAWANSGSSARTVRCSRRRCQPTSSTIPSSSGSMT